MILRTNSPQLSEHSTLVPTVLRGNAVRDALRSLLLVRGRGGRTTRSVADGIPTQSVGTRRLCATRGKIVVVSTLLAMGWTACRCHANANDEAEPAQQIGLADLPAYRTALSGKPTADDARPSDPPLEASFRDLWNRPAAFQGRRVIVEGRVERIFRQGSVGSFPPLAEIWVTAPSGDPFCLIVPQGTDATPALSPLPAQSKAREPQAESRPGLPPPRIAEPGTIVRFTGTFLKMVRYTAGDGARLAPLIVGNRPPLPAREAAPRSSGEGASRTPANQAIDARPAGSSLTRLLVLVLAVLAASLVGWRVLHGFAHRQRLRKQRAAPAASRRGRRPPAGIHRAMRRASSKPPGALEVTTCSRDAI